MSAKKRTYHAQDNTLRTHNVSFATRLSLVDKEFLVSVKDRLKMPMRELLVESVALYAAKHEKDE